MKAYEVIVVGSGSGLSIVSKALERGLKVALVAEKYLGGTCLNVGCVPSKTLIYPADVAEDIREARKLGVNGSVGSIDFSAIMERMRQTVARGIAFNRQWMDEEANIDFYEARGRFTGDFTMEVEGGRQIRGKKIFLASGARPAIPAVEGLAEAGYLTNETLPALTALPESMVILGGGFIAIEYAHFFAAMGTGVTVIEAGERLVAREEPEVSRALEEALKKRMSIHTSATVERVIKNDGGCVVRARMKDGKRQDFTCRALLVAAGRVSNAPSLTPEATGVELNEAGFIKVNDYLETTKKGIWAIGDATGRQMFTHAADRELKVAWHNAMAGGGGGKRMKMAFALVPHAVYTRPQIASVGLTEAEARRTHDVLVGKAAYSDTVQGEARRETEGFAKAIVDKKKGTILGFHVVGPEATELIQEVVLAMTHGLTAKSVAECIHIFPAMSELVQEVLDNLE